MKNSTAVDSLWSIWSVYHFSPPRVRTLPNSRKNTNFQNIHECLLLKIFSEFFLKFWHKAYEIFFFEKPCQISKKYLHFTSLARSELCSRGKNSTEIQTDRLAHYYYLFQKQMSVSWTRVVPIPRKCKRKQRRTYDVLMPFIYSRIDGKMLWSAPTFMNISPI